MSRRSHRGSVWRSLLRLTVSQTVQFAALGIAEVIVRRASPAGLMQNAPPSIARGRRVTTVGRVAIAHRA